MAIKKRKRSVDLLIFVFIIAIMLSSYSSYSKYVSSVNTSTSVNIATWNVKVNSSDITDGSSLSNSLAFNIINPDTTKVGSGKIAPSSQGYFDITVDTTSAEVAAKCTINIDMSNTSTLEGMNIVGYQKLTSLDVEPDINSAIAITPSNNIYSISNQEILLSNNQGQVVNYRVYLEWTDNGTSNSNQTSAVLNLTQNSLSIPVEILVEQLN